MVAIKALVNNSMPANPDDVTEGYYRPSVEHLRIAVERVTAFVLERAGRSLDQLGAVARLDRISRKMFTHKTPEQAARHLTHQRLIELVDAARQSGELTVTNPPIPVPSVEFAKDAVARATELANKLYASGEIKGCRFGFDFETNGDDQWFVVAKVVPPQS